MQAVAESSATSTSTPVCTGFVCTEEKDTDDSKNTRPLGAAGEATKSGLAPSSTLTAGLTRPAVRRPDSADNGVKDLFRNCLRRLALQDASFGTPEFAAQLRSHFQSLPRRYIQNMSTDNVQDVILHMQMFEIARMNIEESRALPQVVVRNVEMQADSTNFVGSLGSLPRSMSLEALCKSPAFKSPGPYLMQDMDDENTDESVKNLFEVTMVGSENTRFFPKIAEMLLTLSLKTLESHQYVTSDGLSLLVYTVCTVSEDAADQDAGIVQQRVENALHDLQRNNTARLLSPNPDFEIESERIVLKERVGSGTYGELHKGEVWGEEVAVKVLKSSRVDANVYDDFVREVLVMRKVRHRNVVQFIGACTEPSNLCLVTEFMHQGTVHDYVRRWWRQHNCGIPAERLHKILSDVACGMAYLHEIPVIHRDLKCTNLLIDANDVVKVSDFGLAKILGGVESQTAETGTYRWMAPEVIAHKSYGLPADVYSFAISIWEMSSGRVPYSAMTPIQAAVAVVQQNLRPKLSSKFPAFAVKLMQDCWVENDDDRPTFEEIKSLLREMEVTEASSWDGKKAGGGIFSRLTGSFAKDKREEELRGATEEEEVSNES